MMKKKCIAIFVCCLMFSSFVGCGKTDENINSNKETENNSIEESVSNENISSEQESLPNDESSVEEPETEESEFELEESDVIDGVEVSYYYRKDKYDIGTYIYVKAENNTDEDKYISVNAYCFSDGEQAGSMSTGIGIEPHSYNIEELYNSGPFDDVKYVVKEKTPETDFRGSGIEIDCHVTEDGNKIEGTAKNTTDLSIGFGKVKFVVYDENKNILYYCDTRLNDLEFLPNAETKFDEYIDYDEPVEDFDVFVFSDTNYD